MSDAAIATICGCIITVVTLWFRVKYGVEAVEGKVKAVEGKVDTNTALTTSVGDKLDHNTSVTTQAKDAAQKAVEHTAACDEDRTRILKGLADHDARIAALERQMGAIQVSVDGVSRDVASTRHEVRGHFQTLMNKVDILSMKTPAVVPVSVPAPQDPK